MTREEARKTIRKMLAVTDLSVRGNLKEDMVKACNIAIEALEQEPKTGYLSIDDVMSVFNDFMCGEVDEDGTETFLEMLKDKAESENT